MSQKTAYGYAYACRVEKGHLRENNEDNIFIRGVYLSPEERDRAFTVRESEDHAPCVMGVFDGMGGENEGEFASLVAAVLTGKFEDSMTSASEGSIGETVNSYIQSANSVICARINEIRGNIGTTLALLVVQSDLLYAVNVGDSRIYHFSGGNLWQVSHDHATAEPYGNRKSRALTQCIGMSEDYFHIAPYISPPIAMSSEDVFLICSDGLTDMVDDLRIKDIIGTGGQPGQMVDGLVNEALAKGGYDNITVAVVKFK